MGDLLRLPSGDTFAPLSGRFTSRRLGPIRALHGASFLVPTGVKQLAPFNRHLQRTIFFKMGR